MPPAPFCLPGPHDIHNAGSVKLAEATRIRLILPGLNLASSGKSEAASSTKPSSKASGEAAAASAKAQKKLRKLQGIASQAEQAHAGIIVDEEVLEGSDSDENEADETAGAEGGSRAVHRSSTGSSGSEQDKRKGPGKAAAASTAAPGGVGQELAARGGRQRQRSLAAGKAGSSSTSRAPDAAGQGSRTAANTSDDGSSCAAGGSGVSSCSSSNSSSRRGSGDKPHVPIWERSLPSGPAEARRTAAAAAGPKVLQTVALKTFSPTLGSFGPMLGDPHDTGQQDGAVASPSNRPPVLRSRSANRSPGGAASVPPALRKHTTPPYSKLSAAATAGAAAAPPLGVEMPSVLRHVNFSSGASAYTPSQLLEKLILR